MKSVKYIFCFLITITNLGFAQQSDCPITKNNRLWNGQLELNDSIDLHFNFRYFKTPSTNAVGYNGYTVEIYNGSEIIKAENVVLKHDKKTFAPDSLFFKMPLFDSEFKCKVLGADSLRGVWINHSRKDKNVLQVSIKPVSVQIHDPFWGKWEVDFSPDNKTENSKAIGIFKRGCWDMMDGTFLTETGDYRFLTGIGGYDYMTQDSSMYLSCFDGSHAFVFQAKKKADGTIEGDFYSGMHWHEKWIGKRNDSFELTNPDSLTFLKPGYESLEFTFPDLNGKQVSLSDAKYKGKVVIVQIMGSWCPNCMDETKFLSPFYDKNKERGLEIIGLAYEKTGDFQKAVTNVQRTQKRFNCKYDLLIAATSSDRAEAAKTLPMLNHIMSFPTTIYIDKKGKVRKIHTGFNGPATGKYYDKFVEDTNRFVEKLLGE